MNKKRLKMDYIAVSSVGKQADYRSVFKYFNKYLITLGEPTTSPSWSLMQMLKHARHAIINERHPGCELYLDSGGYQIIVGYIPPSRILEYVECFHIVLEKYHAEMDKIFSLDINNFSMTTESLIEWNKISTLKTMDSIKKYPILRDKVFFIVQSRNERVFEIWRKMFVEEKVYESFDLFSFGGLVGLKKETNAIFNHAVPATMWLLTYQKKYGFNIKQIHWLGQSSRVVFIALALLEKLYGVYLTADSSEIVRFAPVAQKLPMLRKVATIEDGKPKVDFDFARAPKDILDMLDHHSWDDDHCPRACRDNLKKWDIDIDILYMINQDLFDYLIWFKYKITGKESDIEKYGPQIRELADFMVRLNNNGILTVNDFAGISSVEENILAIYNASLSNSTIIVPDELNDKYLQLCELINSLKNYKYKEKRSIVSKRKFEETGLKKLDNCDYIELSCQNIDNAIVISDEITDKILEIKLENCTIDNLKTIHPTMEQGHTAKTTLANIEWILKFKDCLATGDTDAADELMREVVRSYVK